MKRFVWRRVIAIARKEIFHIARDPITVAFSLVLPVVMILLFGAAIEFNPKDIPLAVSDLSKSYDSRLLIQQFGSSEYFRPHGAFSPYHAMRDVMAERAKACLIIPPFFQQDLMNGRTASVQVLLDGADNSTVGAILSYLGTIQDLANRRVANFSPPQAYELRTRFLFNPELNSKWFSIPGLAVVVMTILSILLTALTIAREWENGSMELLLSTPVQPLEIIIGKIAPYAALCLAAVCMCYIIARTVFAVPFVGKLWVFSLGCILFLICYLAQGLFLSITLRKQQLALQFAMVIGLLPTNLLSGFIFPIESMPIGFQYFTMLFPARWFVQISRDTFLKGSSAIDLWKPFFALILTGIIMIFISVRRFKRDLEP
jgi:ABC-2 type transport system permease protein